MPEARTFQDVRAIATLLADFTGPWAFCGGWAIELLLDRQTREHKDIDVAIARRDQLAMQAYLTTGGWHLQVAHEGTLTDWQPGEYLELPRHGIWGRHPGFVPDFLELLLNEIEDDPEGGGPVLCFRRDRTITRSLDAAIVRAPSGLPILAPEIALLYKSNALDEANWSDFRAALPALGPDRRVWLGTALAHQSPAHPWLADLAALPRRTTEIARSDGGGPMDQRPHVDTETLRRSADRLQALARTGLFFADNEYDRVRYEEIVSIAAELCGLAARRSPAELHENWAGDVGYVTPRVGVGAVIFNAQRELLLLQRPESSLWALPVGFSEVGEAPAAGIAREVREETGLIVRPDRLLGVYDCQGGPWLLHHLYNIVLLCTVVGGTLTATVEAPVSGYFRADALPELLPHHARTIADAFTAPDNGPIDAAFDRYDPLL